MEAKIEAPKTRTFGALHFCIMVTVIGYREYDRTTRRVSSPGDKTRLWEDVSTANRILTGAMLAREVTDSQSSQAKRAF
jgi:hypothetical protein